MIEDTKDGKRPYDVRNDKEHREALSQGQWDPFCVCEECIQAKFDHQRREGLGGEKDE